MPEKNLNLNGPFLKRYLKNDLINFHLILTLSSLFLWVIYRFSEKRIYCIAADLLIIFTVISFLIHFNIRNLHTFLGINRNVSEVPFKRIYRIDALYSGIFIGINICIFIFLSFGSSLGIIEKITSILKKLLTIILKFFFRNADNGAINKTPKNNIDTSMVPSYSSANNVWTAFLKLIESVMNILAIIVIIIGVGYLIIKIFRNLSFKSDSDNDEHKFIESESRSEKITRENIENGYLKSIFRKSLRDKIRNFYKSLISKGLKKKGKFKKISLKIHTPCPDILDTRTPTEIEIIAGINDKEVHDLYMKARYSNTELSEEDFKKIRKGK